MITVAVLISAGIVAGVLVVGGGRRDADVDARPTTTGPVSDERESALRVAANYIEYMAFSQRGLVSQLEFEEFPRDVATWAAANVDADWNEEATESATASLDLGPSSEADLRDLLGYEGFTRAQIDHAIAAMKALGRL